MPARSHDACLRRYGPCRGLMACDFSHAGTVLPRGLYVLVLIYHDSRFVLDR